MKYRKKPIQIEAVQIISGEEPTHNYAALYFSLYPVWLSKAVRDKVIVLDHTEKDDDGIHHPVFLIKTLEDGPSGQVPHYATTGDWIVQGVHGELYPIKPEIFESTYEKVGEEKEPLNKYVAFLHEVAKYFDNRPTNGEDKCHWSNVYNAENCRKIAARFQNIDDRCGKFVYTRWKIGDRVEKINGSSWHGKIVGYYTTEQTMIGYCVESEREPGSVQIYPEKALRKVADDETLPRKSKFVHASQFGSYTTNCTVLEEFGDSVVIEYVDPYGEKIYQKTILKSKLVD